MGFVQAVQSGFKNYVNFSGRASRSEAAYWLLFGILVSICTGIIDAAIWGDEFFESERGALNTGSISSLILFFPGLTLSGAYTTLISLGGTSSGRLPSLASSSL